MRMLETAHSRSARPARLRVVEDRSRSEGPRPVLPRTSTPKSAPKEGMFPSVRVNWQIKAVLPVAFVLLNGLLLFLLSTVSFRDPERHAVLVVAGAGAVIICAVLIVVLAYL